MKELIAPVVLLFAMGGAMSVSANNVVGNASAGKELYMGCSGCHGADGMGNETLRAPRLAGQKAWYIVTQLDNFKTGLRGTISGDSGGAMMRPMALLLENDQAVADVAAYLESL